MTGKLSESFKYQNEKNCNTPYESYSFKHMHLPYKHSYTNYKEV